MKLGNLNVEIKGVHTHQKQEGHTYTPRVVSRLSPDQLAEVIFNTNINMA